MSGSNSSSSVPARIVMVGTAKIPLSQRFNQLDGLNALADQPMIIRQVPRTLNNGFGGSPSMPFRSDNVARMQQTNKADAFLKDDYMQNDLYGPPINRRPQPRLNGGGGGGGNFIEQYELGYDEENQNRDPVDLPLDDYYVNRFRPRRPFMNRFRRGGGGRGRFASQRGYNNRPPYGIFDLDSYVPMLIDEGIQQRNHRSSFNSRMPRRTPIQNRLSVIRAKRINVRYQTPRFRPQNQPRFAPRFNSRGRFANKRNRQNNNPRSKMTAEDLDRELDGYMKSTKHPRIAVES